MAISHVVMDFDGTCTVVSEISELFLTKYLDELNKSVFSNVPITKEEWIETQETVRRVSPKAGWTIAVTPSAPAAPDPYILSFECAKFLLRKYNIQSDIPQSVYVNAIKSSPAAWRNEAKSVFETLLMNNISIIFISNASSQGITERIKSLFSVMELPKGVIVKSDAQKHYISELSFDSRITADAQKVFNSLPVAKKEGIDRPIYLRRGFYFEAICAAFKNDLSQLSNVVFCGDIWELDLAMPQALGANIHLIERAKPFDTYDYELGAVGSNTVKGKISKDLTGLLQWVS